MRPKFCRVLDVHSSIVYLFIQCILQDIFRFVLILSFSAPTMVHGARISGLEARMSVVEDRICDLDARGSEEADNLANDRDLDRFVMTGIAIL